MKNTINETNVNHEMEDTKVCKQERKKKFNFRLSKGEKAISCFSSVLMCTAIVMIISGLVQSITGNYERATQIENITSIATPHPRTNCIEVPASAEMQDFNDDIPGEPTESSSLRYEYTEEEYENLLRVVEAEVTGDNPINVPSYPKGRVMTDQELLECKIRVAQVILNRIESPYFPDNMNDVIFQKNAFSPTADGRFYSVTVTDLTRRACDMALTLHTHDYTATADGKRAYFFQMYYCKPNKHGDLLFTDPAGHEYYSYNR